MMTGYRYFLSSAAYNADKDAAEKKFGKQFVPGTVISNGSRKEFSFISTTANNSLYSDTKIVAEGRIEEMKYTNPSSVLRRD